MNPQSKRKHQRTQPHDRSQPADPQERGSATPRHARDSAREGNRSPSQVESRRHSRGSR